MSSCKFGDKTLKTLFSLVVLCIFCGATAFGQSSAANGQAHMLSMPENSQHASQIPMAQPADLLEHSGTTWAHGERPLWEVMPEKTPDPPLGDVARALRKQHTATKKATKIWTN